MTTGPPDRHVTIRHGSIHLPRELCDAHLADACSVALIVRDGRALLLPLMRGSAGGILLKIRNAHGDRVLHAAEFLREHGLADDFAERRFSVAWLPEMSALLILGLAPM